MAWAPIYASSAELKAYTRIPNDDTLDDVQAALALEASSRAIDVHTNRQFGLVATAEERFYTARWDHRRCRWIVPIDDLMTTTSFAIEVNGSAITAYDLEPSNAEFKARPWTQVVIDSTSAVFPTAEVDAVDITGRWGWTTVPDAIKQACLLQANRFLSRRNSPYGVTGSPELGSELRLLSRLDPDVAVILAPYVRWWGAA